MDRQTLIETCFADVPETVAGLTLRPLSAGSFALLGRLKNPMVAPSTDTTTAALFGAIVQYIWVHTADVSMVASIQTVEDLPQDEINALAFQISMPDAMKFLEGYKRSSLKMAAALAEVDDEDEDAAPGKPELAPVGSPRSSSPSVPPETLPVNVTSFGSSHSGAPSPTSTLPTPRQELPAGGCIMPDLTTSTHAGSPPQETPSSD